MLKIEKKDLDNFNEFIGQIIDQFEDFLEERDIALNNDERDEDPDAAIIYGSDYGDLYLRLETLIMNWSEEEKE